MQLRPYQSAGISKINRLFKRGVRRVLAVAPTGAGKGTMAAEMIRLAAKRGERVLFLVHRREIVTDVLARLAAIKCNMDRVTVETVQTLAKCKPARYDLVVADEAHHYRAEEWQAVLEGTGKKAHVVGFTATPQRSDGKAMGDVFDEIVDVVSYSSLLAMKPAPIVPCRVLTSPHPLDGALALHSVDAYQRYANGSTALVFERDTKAARESFRAFNAAGIAAELIVGTTSDEQRALAFERLRSGKTKALINVYVLTEGVDLPWVRTIILSRPCQHRGTYMQIAGRGLRAAAGKRSALLVDLGGASYLHGEPTEDRPYSLSGRAIGSSAGERVPVERGEPKGVLGLDLVEFSEEMRASHVRPAKPARRNSPQVDWDAEPMLGKASDRVVAKRHGVAVDAARDARVARGIPPFRTWRRPLGAIRWGELKHRLGRETDSVVAADIGVTEDAVRKARLRLGIESLSVRGVARSHDWSGEARLGKMPDTQLAKILGKSNNAVFSARRRLNIPSYDPSAQAAE